MLTLSGPSLSANCKRPFSYITRHMWAEGDRIHLVAFLLYLTRKTMFVFLLIIPPLKRRLLWNLKKEFDPTENRFFSHRIDLFSEGDKTFWKLPFTISPLRFCREIMIKKKKDLIVFSFTGRGCVEGVLVPRVYFTHLFWFMLSLYYHVQLVLIYFLFIC